MNLCKPILLSNARSIRYTQSSKIVLISQERRIARIGDKSVFDDDAGDSIGMARRNHRKVVRQTAIRIALIVCAVFPVCTAIAQAKGDELSQNLLAQLTADYIHIVVVPRGLVWDDNFCSIGGSCSTARVNMN